MSPAVKRYSLLLSPVGFCLVDQRIEGNHARRRRRMHQTDQFSGSQFTGLGVAWTFLKTVLLFCSCYMCYQLLFCWLAAVCFCYNWNSYSFVDCQKLQLQLFCFMSWVATVTVLLACTPKKTLEKCCGIFLLPLKLGLKFLSSAVKVTLKCI